MKIESHIKYVLKPMGAVRAESTWHVPYCGWIKSGRCDEVEANGFPTLVGVKLVVGDFSKILDFPGDTELREWMGEWSRSEKYIQSELNTLFSEAAVEEYWQRRHEAA